MSSVISYGITLHKHILFHSQVFNAIIQTIDMLYIKKMNENEIFLLFFLCQDKKFVYSDYKERIVYFIFLYDLMVGSVEKFD